MSERIPVHLVMVHQQTRNDLREIPDHEFVISTSDRNVKLSDDQLSVGRAVSMVVRNRLPVFSHLENLYANACVSFPFPRESLVPPRLRTNRQVPDHSPLELRFLAV